MAMMALPKDHADPSAGKDDNVREIGIREVAGIAWRGKAFILLTTLLLTFFAGLAATLIPKKYSATVMISPVADDPSGGMGGLDSVLSQFGGLAALAGISVGGSGNGAESLAVLQSEALTETYVRDNQLLPILYADKWSKEKGQWKSENPKEIPTLWQANELFKKKIRAVADDKKTGMIKVTIYWQDPVLAARWANGLVKITNEYLRQKSIAESERNIKYLTEQAVSTNIVKVQEAIYALLEKEIKRVMLAKGRDEYALKVIDPAIAPEKPDSPKLLLWVVLGFLAGLLGSLAVVVGREVAKYEH